MSISRLFFICILSIPSQAFPAEWYVNNTKGDDSNSGISPENAVKTINLAIRKTIAGDTVHLSNTGTPYRQDANFYGHEGGTPGKPITLDGHGSTLRGSDVLSPDGWKPYRDGTYQRDDVVSRSYLLVDGAMVYGISAFNVLKPGEFCYMPDYYERLFFCFPEGKQPTDFEITAGQSGGGPITLDPQNWENSHSTVRGVKRYNGLKTPTWIKLNGVDTPLVTARERLEPGQWTSENEAMYFRSPAGKPLDDLVVEAAVRGNGVQMNGTQSHFVIRDLNVEYVYNDGFNIHGKVKDACFYNCNASNCGDEGFSSHDECETLLDGAIYINCDNGIANVNTAGVSVTKNVTIRNSRHVGILLISKETATHVVENAILIDNPAQFSGADLKADNLLIIRTSEAASATAALQLGRNCEIQRVTAIGNTQLLRLSADSSVKIENAVFGPNQGNLHVRSQSPDELLSLASILSGAGNTMQWGAKPPWIEKPFGEWLTDRGIVDANLTNDLILRGEIPTQAGCTGELLKAALKHLRK